MIRAIGSLLALVLVVPTSGQTTQATDFVSPCPSVFSYEPPGTEAGKWYGVVNLTTDTTLYALWLNIVLDAKADILGNWVGEVTTEDNMDFKIENTKMKINPGPPQAIRFFIQYNATKTPPKLKAIRFNGREICEIPVVDAIKYEDVRPEVTTSTTVRPTVTTTLRSYNRQQTTLTPQYWQQTEKQQTTTKSSFWTQTNTDNNYKVKSVDRQTTTLKPHYWTEAKTTENTITTTLKPQYWQPPTLKPVYWTQENSENIPQTTVSSQVWPYAKVDNHQQVTTTVRPTAQLWSQTRTESKPHTTTEKNLKTKTWSYVKAENTQQTQSEDKNIKPIEKYQNSSRTITENSQAQFTVGNNQQTASGNRFQTKNSSQTEVKQVLQTKYWPKIPAENNTAVAAKVSSRTEGITYTWPESQQKNSDDRLLNQSYERLPVKQVVSIQNQDQSTDIPIYVRPEDGQAVSGNINEVRDNLQAQTNNGTGSKNRLPVRVEISYQKTTEQKLQNRNEGVLPIKRTENYSGGKQSWTEEKTSSWSGDTSQSWADQSSGVAGIDSLSYDDANDGSIKNLEERNYSPVHDYQLTTEILLPDFQMPYSDEYDMPKKEDKVEYYTGGLPIFYIPHHGPHSTIEPECGKVLLNKNKPRNRESTSTLEGQWPWQIALYQQQTSVDFRYICGGTLVSKRHVITAAHCVTKKASIRVVNKNTLTVYLGKHNLRNSVEGVQVKFAVYEVTLSAVSLTMCVYSSTDITDAVIEANVNRILVHPEYDAMNFKSDLAILELRDSVKYSDRVQPACLWPEHEIDLKNIVGQKGSVVGWGFEVTGMAREELTLLEMPVVDQQTCIDSYADFFRRFTSNRTYCAGYRDSGTTCNGDSGGGMVFEKGDHWYLRGVVSLSVARQGEYRCDPTHYVIFTDVAKFLPWIEDNIEDYY